MCEVLTETKLFDYRHETGKVLPVRLQLLRDDYTRYCIQFAGGGHYYKDESGVVNYLKKRFRKTYNIFDVREVLNNGKQVC